MILLDKKKVEIRHLAEKSQKSWIELERTIQTYTSALIHFFKLANHRERALYVNHLPASISTAKMEGILEMEADCSVEEVVLMKAGLLSQLPRYTSIHKQKQLFSF